MFQYLSAADTADTSAAHILPTIGNQSLGGSTEHAERLKLLENDLVVIHKNLQFIPLVNIQRAADLNGKNNPTQLIHFPDYTC